MRLCRILVVLSAALALAGCVNLHNLRPPWAKAPVQQQYSELDAMMYGAPAPPSYPVRRVREVVRPRAPTAPTNGRLTAPWASTV